MEKNEEGRRREWGQLGGRLQYIYFREKGEGIGREKEREKEFEADSVLSTSPMWGSIPQPQDHDLN